MKPQPSKQNPKIKPRPSSRNTNHTTSNNLLLLLLLDHNTPTALTSRVAVGGLVGPFAAVGGRGEGEAVGAGELVRLAVHAVVEVAALGPVTGAEVAPLVSAEFRGLGGL